MTDKTIQRSHPQTAEDKKPIHYAADWWIYIALAIFVGGLLFLTYALTLRGDMLSEFGKPGTKTAPPQVTSQAPAARPQ